MKVRIAFLKVTALILLIFSVYSFMPNSAYAHCDTLEGPVVKDAKIALEKGDVMPVFKWVKEEKEGEVQAAFNKALIIRTENPEDKDKADMEFFETVIRIHREGEGEEFTGLKPVGVEFGPAVNGADRALERGSVDDLVKFITDNINANIRERFKNASEKKQHAEENVEAGREYVKAYVEFMHYVEKLYLQAVGNIEDHQEHKTEAVK